MACPVLLVHGAPERGIILTPEQVTGVAERLGDCVVESMPDVGHAPHLADPCQFYKAVAFFAESL